MSVENYRYLLERHSFFDLFERVVVSGHEKMIKPELNLYQILCKRYSFNPEETLFIDDSLVNCHAAESLGMKAIHFSRDQFDSSEIQQYFPVLSSV